MVISKTIQHGSNHEKPAVVTDSAGSNADASPSHETTEFVLSKDGFKLFPQPILGDHLDPLNWSFAQKHTILAIIMSIYFMFTFITTTTVPSFPELEENYSASLEQMNWTVAIPALGLAVGPLLWASPADIIGRRPIIILGTAMALASTVGAALAPNYSGYMAARFFQGLGVSPASNVGLAVINDLFFEHERGQKVGLWVLAIDLGLLFGPLIGGAVDLAGYVWIQWLSAILFGVMLLAELLLLPETLYPRHLMLSEQQHHRRHSCTDADKAAPSYHDAERSKLPRTKKLAFINVAPVPGVRHPKPFDTIYRFIKSFKYAVVPISIMTYCFGWYWWVLSVVTLVPTAYAENSPQIQGVLYLGLIIGTLVSEVCCSGSLSDWIVLHLSKRNNNQKTPEMRIWLAYPAATLTAVGLIVWGVSVDRRYHWIVGQVAFAILDAYPMQSMAMMTFYAVMLNLSAFIDPFFVVPWVENVGFTWTMAGHAIITIFFCVPVLALLHRFGTRLRSKSGQPTWVNPEFERGEVYGGS
ncbi:Major facilitator superfamily domain, general substrate transporter, partial [Metarhizium majus ARSEF 297]